MHCDRESARAERSGLSIYVVSEHTSKCKSCRACGLCAFAHQHDWAHKPDRALQLRKRPVWRSIGEWQYFGLVGH